LGDVVPPELESALLTDEESQMRERERLWYVACTRARELLVLPELPQADQKSWARVVDVGHRELPVLDLAKFSTQLMPPAWDVPNEQTAELFAVERSQIEAVSIPLRWVRPSDYDFDRLPVRETTTSDPGETPETAAPIGGGRLRGLLLHKLIEEVLTGEVVESFEALTKRATELIPQLVVDPQVAGGLPAPSEFANTVIRTLALPELAPIRPQLVAEWPVFALTKCGPSPARLAGRIDAMAFENDRPTIVVDWKSDISPSDEDIANHSAQLSDYLRATGAPRGALVYMTTGAVRWVEKPSLVH
jgi:CRISPR-associated exonuclease Cas4